MNLFLCRNLKLILFAGIIGLTGTACSNLRSTQLPSKPTTQGVIGSPLPQKTNLPAPQAEVDRYEMALDKAYGALTISQSARGAEDWRLIAMQWSQAISLMKSVPARSPHKAIAQKKIIQYQKNLSYAQQQANRPQQPRPEPVVAVIPEAPFPIITNNRTIQTPSRVEIARIPVQAPPPLVIPPTGVFQAAIKSRHGGTPVVDVTFNNGERFEMIVDTGASGTVITQQMASILGVVPIGKARANTASDRNVEFAIGRVNSIEVGGAVISNVPVAIAPLDNLDMGLLGQDFFSNYDVTIKRDVVEFRPR